MLLGLGETSKEVVVEVHPAFDVSGKVVLAPEGSPCVEGWEHLGETVTPFTYFGGLYARATDSEPFRLPPRWLEAKSR